MPSLLNSLWMNTASCHFIRLIGETVRVEFRDSICNYWLNPNWLNARRITGVRPTEVVVLGAENCRENLRLKASHQFRGNVRVLTPFI